MPEEQDKRELVSAPPSVGDTVHWQQEDGDPENGPTGELHTCSGTVIEIEGSRLTVLTEEGEQVVVKLSWLVAPEDDLSCPGCGCVPGDGITQECEHELGCGYWRAYLQEASARGRAE